MASFNRGEGSVLKGLMREEGWTILLKFYKQTIDELNAEPITGANAFETLRDLHLRQGKVDGLTKFFEDLERGAFEA